MSQHFQESDEIQKILEYHCPRYSELPNLQLYMDQVLLYVDQVLDILYAPDEKRLTASMVNNYVKQKVLPAPEKKKYSRNHLAYLLALCILKKVFSIAEIEKLIQIQTDTYPTRQAYDSFMEQLEFALQSVFGSAVENTPPVDEMAELLRAVVTSVATKVYVQKRIATFSEKTK